MVILHNKFPSDLQLAVAGVSCDCKCDRFENFLFSWEIIMPPYSGFSYSYFSEYLDLGSVISLITRTEQHGLYFFIRSAGKLYSYYVTVSALFGRMQTAVHGILKHCRDHISVLMKNLYQKINILRL